MLKVLIPVGLYLNKIARKNKPGEWSVISYWRKVVEKYGDRVALMFEEDEYTYKDLDEQSNRYAECFLELGIQQHHVVALCLPNCPEFLLIVLGLFKIGATAALLNTNVTGKSLVHCLEICRANRIVYHSETLHVIKTLKDVGHLEYFYPCKDDATRLEFGRRLNPETKSSKPILDTYRSQIKLTDTVVHIFTSGTTGLPKAAKINHIRFVGGAYLFSKFSRISQTDRLYCTLPLYHASGLIIGWGMCINVGATLILKKKFSASQFWADCNKYNATIIQYIGELCRYLCNSPPSINDHTHQVRLALGNGLRPDVWTRFQERFRVPRIMEFYSATEGNTGFINAENKYGAIGYMSPLLRKKHPAKFIRLDCATMEPVRDSKTNMCFECETDEIGELIALIDNDDVMRRFDGYSDETETNKKILRDVFKKGDMYFRSGDLMRTDSEGFVYFVDRSGDTFRWKGENVSTTEVAQVIAEFPGGVCLDTAVYGVCVSSFEGRAGMAIIYADPDFDLNAFYQHLLQHLPAYARPYFVRLTDQPISATETHKHRTVELAQEGFDPRVVKHDPLYFRDDKAGTFIDLTNELYESIQSGDRVV